MPTALTLPLLAAALAGGGDDDAANLVARAGRRGGGADVVRTARCSAGSRVELDLSRDDGAIEAEADLDQAGSRNGVRWRVVLRHNGRTVVNRSAVTRGTGDIDLDRRVPDRRGADVVTFSVTRAGERCRVTARI
jgi:hypothetical protein